MARSPASSIRWHRATWSVVLLLSGVSGAFVSTPSHSAAELQPARGEVHASGYSLTRSLTDHIDHLKAAMWMPKWDPNSRIGGWLHIPKCGTSFGTTYVRWLDVRNRTALKYDPTISAEAPPETLGVPYLEWAGSRYDGNHPPIRAWTKCVVYRRDDMEAALPIPRSTEYETFTENVAMYIARWGFNDTEPRAQFVDPLNVDYQHCEYASHLQLDQDTFNVFKNHMMGFFREPRQLAASAYDYLKYGDDFGSDNPFEQILNDTDVVKYGKHFHGIATRMLAGQLNGLIAIWAPFICNGFNMTEYLLPMSADPAWAGLDAYTCEAIEPEPNVRLALKRLQGFNFVGLTDRWAESICLFHVKHGGECINAEFQNSRPTAQDQEAKDRRKQTLDELTNYYDPYDAQIYSQAYYMFFRDLEAYNVTTQTCRAICPDAPHGVFNELPDEEDLPL